ncbi:uncharacterized protein LOC126071255 [Elephas maximus indicus]|uniref:uncharacterized protein LOC126071255 n=1 Tax=Elephas maximus indicus TaxID=99487 RepID=UPI002116597A|nr:uncharacterized protein LOC126071255 [Elephas maximus indicus]
MSWSRARSRTGLGGGSLEADQPLHATAQDSSPGPAAKGLTGARPGFESHLACAPPNPPLLPASVSSCCLGETHTPRPAQAAPSVRRSEALCKHQLSTHCLVRQTEAYSDAGTSRTQREARGHLGFTQAILQAGSRPSRSKHHPVKKIRTEAPLATSAGPPLPSPIFLGQIHPKNGRGPPYPQRASRTASTRTKPGPDARY